MKNIKQEVLTFIKEVNKEIPKKAIWGMLLLTYVFLVMQSLHYGSMMDKKEKIIYDKEIFVDEYKDIINEYKNVVIDYKSDISYKKHIIGIRERTINKLVNKIVSIKYKKTSIIFDTEPQSYLELDKSQSFKFLLENPKF